MQIELNNGGGGEWDEDYGEEDPLAESRVSNPNKPKIDTAKSNSGSVSGSTNRNGSANTGNDTNNKNGMNNKSNVIPKIIKIGSQKGENEKDKAKNNISI